MPIAIQMTNCQGPMARRIADLRLALGIMSAPDPGARDPRWVPGVAAGAVRRRPIQLAVVRDPAGAGIDRAADWLADAGYEVVDAEPAGDR
jgi:amidase